MPIFMDRHEILGVTAEEVAKVHQEDLKIQHKYNCRAMTYWFDKERGTAFCLIEAPDRKAVEQMHRHAHGLMPNRIIEVDSELVEVFLGRIEDPDSFASENNPHLQVFQDPGFRVLMVTGLKDAALILSKAGHTKGREHFRKWNKIIKKIINRYHGRNVKSAYDGFVLSFTSASKAIECAFEIQDSLEEYKNKINGVDFQAGIGLSAGEPVTEHKDFFGKAIQLARRLCYVADGGRIMISSKVREQYREEMPQVLHDGNPLKPLTSVEEQFLNRLMDTTERFWYQQQFSVADFCRQIGVSKSQLYRKTKRLTSRTPNDFMKEFRLKKAAKLIDEQPDNITKIAFETGFSNPSYFSKCFKKRYGLLPSEYINNIR